MFVEYNAVVRFLSKEEGGRISPPMPPYKPHMKFGQEMTSCTIVPKNASVKIMEFGIDYEVTVTFQFEEHYTEQIKSGLNMGLYEGNRLVGHGYLR
jgi:translation elongation factor EF-Tu-like GTPase